MCLARNLLPPIVLVLVVVLVLDFLGRGKCTNCQRPKIENEDDDEDEDDWWATDSWLK